MAQAKKDETITFSKEERDEALESCRQIEKQNLFISKARKILEVSISVEAENAEHEKQRASRRQAFEQFSADVTKQTEAKEKELKERLKTIEDEQKKANKAIAEFEVSTDERKAKLTKEVEWLEGQIKLLAAEKDKLVKENEDKRREVTAEYIRSMAAKKKDKDELESEIERLRGVLGQLRATPVTLSQIARG